MSPNPRGIWRLVDSGPDSGRPAARKPLFPQATFFVALPLPAIILADPPGISTVRSAARQSKSRCVTFAVVSPANPACSPYPPTRLVRKPGRSPGISRVARICFRLLICYRLISFVPANVVGRAGNAATDVPAASPNRARTALQTSWLYLNVDTEVAWCSASMPPADIDSEAAAHCAGET